MISWVDGSIFWEGDKLLIHSNIYVLVSQGCTSNDINDYKFFCFNGRVEFMKIDFDRHYNHGANYYDRDFKLIELEEVDACPSNPNKQFECPANFELMICLAERISKNHKFLRVDFYDVNGRVYFGETTFYPASGMGKFGPADADLQIGKLLQLQ